MRFAALLAGVLLVWLPGGPSPQAAGAPTVTGAASGTSPAPEATRRAEETSSVTAAPHAPEADPSFPTVAILCYHDISSDPKARLDAVPADTLQAQIRRAKANGWTFVSLARLRAARDNPGSLPARALVLTFDDGYRSFVTRALPILREEKVPAVVAIVTEFIDRPPAGMPAMMTWKDVVALERAADVEVVSHSHGLHHWVRNNPQGDTSPSVTTRMYLANDERYEDRDNYFWRLREDMKTSRETFKKKLGRDLDVLAWPYGEHNAKAREIAAAFGYPVTLALGDRLVTRADLEAGLLPRYMVYRGQPIAAAGDGWLHPAPRVMRAAQVDLDEVWNADRDVFDRNVQRLIAEVRRIGATDAILQSCPDPKGDGYLRETWFVNHQTATRADVWTAVATKFKHAGLKVWVRAPSLNLSWAWEKHPDWRIPFRGSRRGVTPWYFRVSPDHAEAREAARDFFGDIAVYLPIDGVLFDDDAYMLEGERLASGETSPEARSAAVREHLEAIKAVVRDWRPNCRFARNLYAPVVERRGVHRKFAQDLDETLRHDDLAVVMAYPHMEGHARDAVRWTAGLARTATRRWQQAPAGTPSGDHRFADPPILFKLQTYDWKHESWLDEAMVLDMAREARKAGMVHLGVYPVLPHEGELANDLLLAPAHAPRPRPQPSQVADTP